MATAAPDVSLTAPQLVADPSRLAAAARFVADRRLGGLFFLDHLVPLSSPTGPVHELAASVGAVAGLDLGIRLGTLVARAPLRGPELTAAVGASAVRLAGGRFVLGVGAGDRLSFDEIDRYGFRRLPLTARVRSVADTIRLAHLLHPGIVTWVGGRHEALVDVAAEHADGWNGWMVPPGELAAVAARLAGARPGFSVTWGGSVVVGETPEEVSRLAGGRGPADTISGTPPEVAAALREVADAGAGELVVGLRPNREDRWRLFADEVLPLLGDGAPRSSGIPGPATPGPDGFPGNVAP